jgi:hypothetical protein
MIEGLFGAINGILLWYKTLPHFQLMLIGCMNDNTYKHFLFLLFNMTNSFMVSIGWSGDVLALVDNYLYTIFDSLLF